MSSIKDLAGGVVGKAGKLKDKATTAMKRKQEPVVPSYTEGNISPKAAIMMMYYMIALDGEITEDEMKQFDEMGMAVDSLFPEMKEKFIPECIAQIEKAIDPEDYYDVIQEGADSVLTKIPRSKQSEITPKLLLWNLLAIANSDGDYADIERKFLKFTARKLDIDKSVFLEMESTVQTLTALEHETEWLKTTNRPYVVIEEMINELEDRKQVIRNSIAELLV